MPDSRCMTAGKSRAAFQAVHEWSWARRMLAAEFESPNGLINAGAITVNGIDTAWRFNRGAAFKNEATGKLVFNGTTFSGSPARPFRNPMRVDNGGEIEINSSTHIATGIRRFRLRQFGHHSCGDGQNVVARGRKLSPASGVHRGWRRYFLLRIAMVAYRRRCLDADCAWMAHWTTANTWMVLACMRLTRRPAALSATSRETMRFRCAEPLPE